MSEFSRFMKRNKIVKENERYVATESLCDEEGKPLEWEFRHISSRENEEIREKCTVDVAITGKPNVYRPRLNSSKYVRKLVAASVVHPDLYDAELQDSYGVKTPEDLLLEMVDDPGEYNMLAEYVQKFQGFQASFQDKVDEAKN